MAVIMLFLGVILGGAVVWFYSKYKYQLEKGLSPVELEKGYVSRELHSKLDMDYTRLQEEERVQSSQVIDLSKKLSASEQQIKSLLDKLETQKEEIENLQKKLTSEFKLIAQEILQDKSNQFIKTNESVIGGILNPLKDEIKVFRDKVDTVYTT